MKTSEKKYVWNSWIESPVSANLFNELRKYCISNDITINKLDRITVGKDFIDKLFGIDRETIYFNLSGSFEKMSELQNMLKRLEK